MAQHVIVTVIQAPVHMTKRSTVKVYRWTFMADMTAVAFAKIANTIPKASTVISANRNSIDHMESIGMKRTCVEVSHPSPFVVCVVPFNLQPICYAFVCVCVVHCSM